MMFYRRLFIFSACLILGFVLGSGPALGESSHLNAPILTASVNPTAGASAHLSGFSFGSAASTPSPAPNAQNPGISASGVMGFQYWKQAQIDEAKQVLERVQVSSPGLSKTPSAEISKNPKLVRMDQRLKQSQLNVEIAQDLTVNDYFLIYLSQFKNKEALTEAAKRLSPEEMAELLQSYQRYLSRTDQVEAPASGLLTGFGPASTGAPIRPGASPSRAQTATQTPRPRL